MVKVFRHTVDALLRGCNNKKGIVIMSETIKELEQRKKEQYDLLKRSPNDQHHCVGFDLPTAAEAFKHFRGMLEE